jgi:hypothetical protein
VKEIECEGLGWIHLAQTSDKLLALLNTVMNLWGSMKGLQFLDYSKAIRISQWSLHHAVNHHHRHHHIQGVFLLVLPPPIFFRRRPLSLLPFHEYRKDCFAVLLSPNSLLIF